MRVTSSVLNLLTPTAIALGNFDGLHLGHKQVIGPILPPTKGQDDRAWATVVTFNPHPQEFFTGESKKLLTPQREKVAELEKIGVQQLVLLPFDQQLALLTPEQFVKEIIVEGLKAKSISVGDDFHFGYERRGTAKDLRLYAADYGINTMIIPLYTINGERISSSAIRQALQAGDIKLVNRLLGRNYSLCGKVVLGQQLGRTIGFPTANLQLPKDKFLPKYGVYAVEVRQLDGGLNTNNSPDLQGVMNWGLRPTVGGLSPILEIHLFDWSGDLYGQELQVNLVDFLRPEAKFASIDALKSQIEADCQLAKNILTQGSP